MSAPYTGEMAWIKSVVCVLLLFVAVSCEVREGSKPPKSSPGATTPSPPSEPPRSESKTEIDDMEVINYIRSGAVLIGWLACMFAGKDVWLMADCIHLFSVGAALFFFPEPLLDYMTDGKLDSHHIYLAQIHGAMLFGLMVMSNSCRQSRDAAAHTRQFVARALGGVLLIQVKIMDFLKGYSDAQRLNEQALSTSTLALVLMTVGNLYYAFKSGSYGGGTSNLRNRVSVHVVIDLLFVTFFGLCNYGYPEVMLSNTAQEEFKPDGIHAHLVRDLGCMMFMAILDVLNSLTFQDNRGLRAFLLARLMVIAVFIFTFELYQWKYQFITNNMHYTMMGMNMLVVGNLLLGYCRPLIYYKQKSR